MPTSHRLSISVQFCNTRVSRKHRSSKKISETESVKHAKNNKTFDENDASILLTLRSITTPQNVFKEASLCL